MSGMAKTHTSGHLAGREAPATDASVLAAVGLSACRRRVLAILASAPLSALALGAPEGLTEAAKRTKEKDKGKDRKRDKQKQSGGSGADVVRVAKKYKGSRYVWGGESPRGFDCSGFTWYCYDKAAGMDIGRTVEEQWKRGRSVGKGDWKAGDLVFFKNTFQKGLSHNGIYIGGGKFIHAENEDTGVVISTLESGYYDDHYAGARRLV